MSKIMYINDSLSLNGLTFTQTAAITCYKQGSTEHLTLKIFDHHFVSGSDISIC